MRTLIVGGGIGGLTAAIALARLGHDVTVAEKSPEFTPVGAGIIMAPNATRVLAELGVDLSRYGHALPSLDIVDADGILLQRIETQRLSARYGPSWALSRPTLHRALLDAVAREVRLVRGSSVTALTDTGRMVNVRFAGDDETHSFGLVVGADGLHSTVRAQVPGRQPRLRYSGVTCWRGLSRNPGFTRAIEAWGIGTRIGVAASDPTLLPGQSAPMRAAVQWPTEFRVFGRHRGG
jgi:2-polyprenyl-6-methoxyphenol hydroxylase-like FAD-dependent oxidoreductase